MIAGSFSFTCLIANDRSKLCFHIIAKDQGSPQNLSSPCIRQFLHKPELYAVIFDSSQTMFRLLSLQPAHRRPIFFERKEEMTCATPLLMMCH